MYYLYIFSRDVSDQLPNGETDRFTQGINNVIAALVPRLKDFHDLLIDPPKVLKDENTCRNSSALIF